MPGLHERQTARFEAVKAEAARYRTAGHWRYVYLGRAPVTLDGGHLPDLSGDIEAIEAAGWRLDHTCWSSSDLVMFVFAAV